MSFDFLYHNYTLAVTVFAAVFGMAYPLILQAIEKVDDKYTSSVLSTDLRKRWQFKAFNCLIVISISCVAVLAYLLEYVDSTQWKYIIVSVAVFLIIALMVEVVLLVQQIISYYSPNELFKLLSKNAKKKDAKALLDLAKFAAKTDDFMLHVESLSVIAQLFQEEQEKASEDKPVEYSADLYDILSIITKRVGDTSVTDNRYNYIGIVNTVYNYSVKGGISHNTYMRMWEMVNRAAKAGNVGWFIDYWTYADQYYRFYGLNGNSLLIKENLDEFYHYHVMIGGLLVYFKHTEWLRHIMHFTQSQPEKFELVPGTMSRIFEIAAYVNVLSEKPFGLLQKYQFMGLEKGVKIDDAIAGYEFQYLALLMIRLWSYDDYNINFANPLDIPMANNENIETNERNKENVERMKREVSRWYKRGDLMDFGLSCIPKEKAVMDKLDQYSNELDKKIIEIAARDEVDEHKAKVIKDEMIVSNANSHCPIPMREETEELDESRYIIQSTPILVTSVIDKKFITRGSKQELGNFGGGLVCELNFRMLNEYLSKAFLLLPCTFSYSICQQDLLEAIDRLRLPDDYVIIENGNALNTYELNKSITYEGNMKGYKRNKILNMGMTKYSPCLWIVKESEIPFIEITETAVMEAGFTEIDTINHLFSNIDHLKPPYEIQLVQSMKVYVLKERSNSCLLKVEYDYSGNKCDLGIVSEINPEVTS